MEIRFAVPTLDGMLATHFLQSQVATIVDVKAGQIKKVHTFDLPGFDPKTLVDWFETLNVQVLIACGIPHDILEALNQTAVNVRTGVDPDTPENIVYKFLNHSLGEVAASCLP